MNSIITELYQVAQEYVSDAYVNPADYTVQQVDDALTVIELIEDGKHEQAVKVGLVY
ncbi:hypothetical protein D3C81_1747610 [compost metagenome]